MSHAAPSQSIHVLLLTPFYPFEGDEVDGSFVAESLMHLPDFDIHLTIIAAKPISSKTLRTSFKTKAHVPGATWVRYPQLPGRAAYASWSFGLYTRLARHVRQLNAARKIDIIHAHVALPCGYAAARLADELSIPFIVTTHGLDAFSSRRERGLSRWWCERASRVVYGKAFRNVCVSEAVSREIKKVLGDAAQTAVVYNGVNTDLFKPSHDDRSLDATLSVNPSQTILSVGRMVPDKGQELVLRAVAKLSAKFPALRYEIIGDGTEQARLAALAVELKIAERVSFHGRVTRRAVAEAMKRCTVFALPSQDEALGCVYLEAMATARPVVASRGEAIEEIIRHGENGWLVRPTALEEMVEALSLLLSDAALRERLGREAHKTIHDGLTLTHQAARLNDIYRACLSRDDEL
jgi:hypothetical protein